MGRRLPPWRQSREPSLWATVELETVLVGSVIPFIVDSRVAGRVLRERSDRWVVEVLASPLPRMHALALATSELTLTGRRTRSKSACTAAGGGSFHVRQSRKGRGDEVTGCAGAERWPGQAARHLTPLPG
jgi:hypothetical protein